MAVQAETIRASLRRIVARDGFENTAKAFGLNGNALRGLLRGRGEIDPSAALKLGFTRRTLYTPIAPGGPCSMLEDAGEPR